MKKTPEAYNIIAYLSTFPPRECGIATFTQDLVTAFDKRFNPATKSRIVALNENPVSMYTYAPRVMERITATCVEEYVALALKLNADDAVKLVNIQHEFGIFGGAWGEYLLPFLQVIRKPVVTTFHSVLREPEDRLQSIVQFIASQSKAIVVMNESSKGALTETYGVPASKVYVTPHGIPQTTFEPSENAKRELGLTGKRILFTFGLLSRDKGIEYAIRALPRVARRYPDTLYIVLGATHPVVRRDEGETYRNFLVNEVERLRLKDYVRFYNKYVSLDELILYLKATDIYLAPTVNLRQSVSGTLSYALGCGRPAIATETEYAKHVISDGIGVLVQPENPQEIERALMRLLGDEKLMRAMGARAYEETRKMIWPNVAARYFEIYKKFVNLEREEQKFPEIKLDHLKRLTDDLGVIQFARFSKPERRYGYSADDNARALLAVSKYFERQPDEAITGIMETYLRFLEFVFRPKTGFINMVNSKQERSRASEEDTTGRAMWSLGYVASRDAIPTLVRRRAEKLFRKGLRHTERLQSPRAVAFAIAGLYYFLDRFPSLKIMRTLRRLADRQVAHFRKNALPRWPWFEDALTYSNSKLPESLYLAHKLTKEKKYLEVAERALAFLSRTTFRQNHYLPIGQAGWYYRDKQRAYFDQQPEDTASMVETKVIAYDVTGSEKHRADAINAFQWFLGRNHLNQMVYDEVTGGCHDGVGQNTLNINQGAESTISYLLARLAIEDLIRDAAPGEPAA